MGEGTSITLSDRQRGILEGWCKNKAGTAAQLVERSTIILFSAAGLNNEEQGRRLRVDRQRVRRWRKRWAENEDRLATAEREGMSDRDLAKLLGELLCDERRSGGPSIFTAVQLTQIIAVACEPPEESGRPVTHWTPRELAAEVIERGIVDSISVRHIDRLLKGGI